MASRPPRQAVDPAYLTIKTFGSSNDRKLKTKGADTWGVLLFCVNFLRAPSSAARVGADHTRLLEAAEMLVRIVNTMDTSGTTMPPSRVERML